jgi:hypothetical protein
MTGGTLINVAYGLEVRGVEDTWYTKFEVVQNEVLKAVLPGAYLVVSFQCSFIHRRHKHDSFVEYIPVITPFTRLVPRCGISALCTEVGGAFARAYRWDVPYGEAEDR